MRQSLPAFLLFAAMGCHGADECAADTRYWADADGDGFGGFGTDALACAAPPGSVSTGGDCADDDPARHPGVDEVCDRRDQDCDGLVDDAPVGAMYADLDGDGAGDPDVPVPNCDAWASADPSDCDDTDATVLPGAPEQCNDRDDDCDGLVDADDPDAAPIDWYPDGDGDGVGTGEPVSGGCTAPGPDLAPLDGDCDDADPTLFPGAAERCNGRDDDCDGLVEGADAWVMPDLEVRIPVTVVPPSASAPGPVVLDVDFGAALAGLGRNEPFDPTSLRAAILDCGGPYGTTELPVQFLDASADLLSLGPDDDPEGDGHGAVFVAWDLDGDPATTELLPSDPIRIGLFFQGTAPLGAWPTDLVAEDTRLGSGALEATFSPDAGGLLDSLVLGSGPSLARQSAATNGNGVSTPAGPLAAQDVPGTVAVHDAGPVTASVRATGHLENATGGFDYTYTYRVITGRPELWVTTLFRTTSALPVHGDPDRTATMRPFQSRWQLDDGVCTTDPGLMWTDASDATDGLTWAWAVPSAYVTHLECSRPETWTAANDYRPCCGGEAGTITTDTSWVDHPVLVLLPHGPGGAASVADLREARLAGIAATAEPAETR